MTQAKLEVNIILAIKYLITHHNLGFFHGDIKPANIFYNNMDVSTDAGTLLYVGDKEETEEAFIINVYTPGYAS